MTKTTTTVNGVQFNGCGCECGQPVNGKSMFRQGHDARMVSRAARYVVLHQDPAQTIQAIRELNYMTDLQELINQATRVVQVRFSDALGTKFWNAAMNLWGKTNTDKGEKAAAATDKLKDVKAVTLDEEQVEALVEDGTIEVVDEDGYVDLGREDAVEFGTVKIGRWTYDAERYNTGGVSYTTKTGELVTANERVAATFKVA